MKHEGASNGLAAFGVLFAGLAASAACAQSPATPSLEAGIFSRAQVERGEESFAYQCTDCHEIEEFTGVGAYLEDMEGKTLWEVFEFVWLEMPEDRPGWLEPGEYADILAYILSVYGHPSGHSDMPVDEAALRAITITVPERPGS
jgi:mono/diheme cytochrome c family protein